jgi:hypothetical protein
VHASPYNIVSHTRCSSDGRPSSDSDSCMMLNEGIGCESGETPARMVWNWRKLDVIGGTGRRQRTQAMGRRQLHTRERDPRERPTREVRP